MFFGTVDMVSESHVERFSKPRFTIKQAFLPREIDYEVNELAN